MSDLMRSRGRVIARTQWPTRGPCPRLNHRAGHMHWECTNVSAALLRCVRLNGTVSQRGALSAKQRPTVRRPSATPVRQISDHGSISRIRRIPLLATTRQGPHLEGFAPCEARRPGHRDKVNCMRGEGHALGCRRRDAWRLRAKGDVAMPVLAAPHIGAANYR